MSSPDRRAAHRRRALWCSSIALSVSLAATACGVPSLTSDPVRDAGGESLNVERLSVAVGDLDRIRDPRYAVSEGPANSSGCSVDSGEVFEPGAGRSWALVGPATDPTVDIGDTGSLVPTLWGRAAASNIASQLISVGWSGSPEVRTHDGAFSIHLTRRKPGYTIHLGMQVFNDSILATARTTPRNVCKD